MRAVIQRVTFGKVSVDGQDVASIVNGLVILLCVGPEDTQAIAAELAAKVATLRIFQDEEGKMNLSCLDVGGQAIVVSQFTLFADTRRGRREAERPMRDHLTVAHRRRRERNRRRGRGGRRGRRSRSGCRGRRTGAALARRRGRHARQVRIGDRLEHGEG